MDLQALGAEPHHDESSFILAASNELTRSPLTPSLHSSSLLNKYQSLLHAVIMTTLIRWATKALRRATSPPIYFPTSSFSTVRPSEVLDEERFEKFQQGQYYPAHVGDVICSRYQIVGKLGFGTTSTVWLARDLELSWDISSYLF